MLDAINTNIIRIETTLLAIMFRRLTLWLFNG